jgi:hypothetical protein
VANVWNRRATSLDLRDEILRRAQEGELTPNEAEAEARKARVRPFAEEAPVVDFDPRREVFWTLAMALAWGIWRDPAKVREYWNDYRRQGWVWRPQDSPACKGWSLERPKYASLYDVWHDAARSGEAKCLATEVQDELWKALSSGKIRATGIPGGEARISIPAYEWIDLSPLYWVSGHEDGVFSHSGAVRYEVVRITQKDIVALWPAPSPKAKLEATAEPSWLKSLPPLPRSASNQKSIYGRKRGRNFPACPNANLTAPESKLSRKRRPIRGAARVLRGNRIAAQIEIAPSFNSLWSQRNSPEQRPAQSMQAGTIGEIMASTE